MMVYLIFDKPSSPYPSVSKQSLENTSSNTKVEVKRSHEEIMKRAKMYIDGRLGKIYLEDSFLKTLKLMKITMKVY